MINKISAIKKWFKESNKQNSFYFNNAKQEIAEKNIDNLFIVGWLSAIIAIILCVIAQFVIPNWTITWEYYTVIPSSLFAIIFGYFYKRSKNKNYYVIQTACVIFYLLIFTGFILLSIFPYPETPQTYISLMLMIVPMLFIFKFTTITILSAFISAVFIFLTIQFKPNPNIASFDIFSTIAAYFIAEFLYYFLSKLRISDFKSRHNYFLLSRKDSLTGLLNKVSCEKDCLDYLDNNPQEEVALCVIDIDDFKDVNDKYGHPYGDETLVCLANCIKNVFPNSITGRIGGDEFMILLKKVKTRSDLVQELDYFCEKVKSSILEELHINVSISCGVKISNVSQIFFKKLYEYADKSLYKAKTTGKNKYIIAD